MIKAIGKFILVKRDENPDVSEGGIHLLRTDEPASGSGKVLSVGKLVDDDVAVGDQVIFPRYAGTEVHINQESFLVIRGSEVMATLEACA